jgi:hypothetical protein
VPPAPWDLGAPAHPRPPQQQGAKRVPRRTHAHTHAHTRKSAPSVAGCCMTTCNAIACGRGLSTMAVHQSWSIRMRSGHSALVEGPRHMHNRRLHRCCTEGCGRSAPQSARLAACRGAAPRTPCTQTQCWAALVPLTRCKGPQLGPSFPGLMIASDTVCCGRLHPLLPYAAVHIHALWARRAGASPSAC